MRPTSSSTARHQDRIGGETRLLLSQLFSGKLSGLTFGIIGETVGGDNKMKNKMENLMPWVRVSEHLEFVTPEPGHFFICGRMPIICPF